MRMVRCFAVMVCVLAVGPAFASNLVTGNGYGFAVVAPGQGAVTKFYAHPYSFERAEPGKPLSEGVPTANFVKEIGWGVPGTEGAGADYVQDSHVIRARSRGGEGLVFMPFGLGRTALVVGWEAGAAETRPSGLRVEWNRPVTSQRVVQVEGVAVEVLRFEGIREALLLIPIGGKAAGRAGNALAGSRAWALISLEKEDDAEAAAREFAQWQAGLGVHALAQREIAELERWRVQPAVHFTGEAERHLWRQSEVMLRIAQCREPNRPGRNGNGLIVASLPDGLWFTPWVRDMAYALVALARMGHQAEARAGLMAYFNAQPTGKMRAETAGADYQVSVVRYFGDGEEEPFFTEEGATNIEFDDWGLVLWALGEYERKFHDTQLLKAASYRGTVYASARDFVVKPLLANTEPEGAEGGRIVAADTSIWEEHQKDQKHFAWSTALAIVGLKEFADLAAQMGDAAGKDAAGADVAALEAGFRDAFVRGGKLHGTREEGEKNDIDGALLAIEDFGVVTDPALLRDTVERMELLKVASGGYRRVRSNYTDPAIFEYWYERQEFVFVDFSLAEVDWRLGRRDEAAAILTRIEDKAAMDHNLLPEMYVSLPCQLFPGTVGDPTGALPMVGYGAGEFVLHLLKREGWR